MKNYKIRNEDEKKIFDKAKDLLTDFLRKKELITNLAMKSIVHLSKNMPTETNLKWVLKEVIDMWIWKITEAPGPDKKTKYIGQRYWTAAAVDLYLNNLKEGKEEDAGLRHEHVYEKRKMIDKILKTLKNEIEIASVLRQAVACVVSNKEHYDLIKGVSGWKRYVVDEIIVIDLLNVKILEHKDLEIK